MSRLNRLYRLPSAWTRYVNEITSWVALELCILFGLLSQNYHIEAVRLIQLEDSCSMNSFLESTVPYWTYSTITEQNPTFVYYRVTVLPWVSESCEYISQWTSPQLWNIHEVHKIGSLSSSSSTLLWNYFIRGAAHERMVVASGYTLQTGTISKTEKEESGEDAVLWSNLIASLNIISVLNSGVIWALYLSRRYNLREETSTRNFIMYHVLILPC